eukprot:CAMPEP_0117757990 /NCGR_PEP_ID=MMETSP0947-20121206/15091_1 /TAXON_ID=44440 /ORGANISM="Chattonella subsalsa, Strain CCMP2191" /LENGTH=148 /DNA_ID=CAMNT_0005578051 /DNA_START=60 /DNA_END=509 /DNA_ORIENTATION=+
MYSVAFVVVCIIAVLVAPSAAFTAPGLLNQGRTAALQRRGVGSLNMLDFTGALAAAAVAKDAYTKPLDLNYGWPVAATETRQGLYKEYTVDITETKENAAGTFKTKEQTAKNSQKYSIVLAILLFGSFVIPMVQYWWYIKDDDVDETL